MDARRDKLQKLPIGIQDFENIRQDGYLYVDKTQYLVDIIDRGKVFFFSRPRRFGKSLSISTFDALFSGKKNCSKDCTPKSPTSPFWIRSLTERVPKSSTQLTA